MKNRRKVDEWMKRARSNMAYVKAGKISTELLYEDLCFNAQQAVEKALKGLCIMHGINFPRTHNIEFLIEILKKGGVIIPPREKKARLLTDYAVTARYPGGSEPVTKKEYQKAFKITDCVLRWVEQELKKQL